MTPGAIYTRMLGCAFALMGVAIGRMNAAEAIADLVPAEAVAQARAFVDGEFNGETDLRLHAAIVDPLPRTRTTSGEEPDLLEGRVFDLAADPLVAVRRHALGTPSRDGDAVVVPVDYDVVATTRGAGTPGRAFVPARSAHERVLLRLRLRDGRWLVEKPPLPHVSAEVLLDTLAARVDYAKRHVLASPRVSRAQQATFWSMDVQREALRRIVAIAR